MVILRKSRFFYRIPCVFIVTVRFGVYVAAEDIFISNIRIFLF